jgi:hypothetical protein
MYTKRKGNGGKVLKTAAKETTMYKAAKAMSTQDVHRNGVPQNISADCGYHQTLS